MWVATIKKLLLLLLISVIPLTTAIIAMARKNNMAPEACVATYRNLADQYNGDYPTIPETLLDRCPLVSHTRRGRLTVYRETRRRTW